MSPTNHIARYERLKAERSNYDNLADDVAQFVNPRKSVTTQRSPGSENTQQIYDTTAMRAAQFCASGIYSYTVQGQAWFALKPRNKSLATNDGVKRFYGEVTEEMLGQLMSSNFPRAVYEGLQDFCSMPAGCVYLEEGTKDLLNFQAYAFGSYVVCNDANGIVDTIYRCFKMTPRQAMQKWGKKALHPEMVKACGDDKLCDVLSEFMHCVYPREEYDREKRDWMNMPFASEYIDVKNKHQLSEGGYQEFPYFVFRFNKNPEDVYGHSPGMDLLPDIRGVNKMQQTMLVAVEKQVNPPWLIPDDGSSAYKWSAKAGSRNYWRATGVGNNKPEPVIIQSDLNAGLEMVREERMKIENGFFLDLFNMLAQRTETMTATEVLQRVEEKLNSFAPTWANLQAELFGPLIIRTLGILARAGAFNAIEAPPELENDADFDITYLSKIALASEMIKARSYFQYVESVTPLMSANPEAAMAFNDTINLPKTYRELAYNLGLPIQWTYSEEEAQERAAARQQAAEQQAAIQNAETAAKAVGALPPQVVEEAANTIDI